MNLGKQANAFKTCGAKKTKQSKPQKKRRKAWGTL